MTAESSLRESSVREASLRQADLRTLTAAPSLPAELPGATFVDAASADAVRTHLDNVVPALDSLRSQSGRLAAWGVELAARLLRGQRLLAAGNGGSAAEAQHLTAELVGRFDSERGFRSPPSPCMPSRRRSPRSPTTTAMTRSSPGRSGPMPVPATC
ncbi:hypothetical protein QFZ60_003647 [Arthrobacter sp. B2I5]|nr:hypothetical protein [Arthrobacter sp. B2I5]